MVKVFKKLIKVGKRIEKTVHKVVPKGVRKVGNLVTNPVRDNIRCLRKNVKEMIVFAENLLKQGQQIRTIALQSLQEANRKNLSQSEREEFLQLFLANN